MSLSSSWSFLVIVFRLLLIFFFTFSQLVSIRLAQTPAYSLERAAQGPPKMSWGHQAKNTELCEAISRVNVSRRESTICLRTRTHAAGLDPRSRKISRRWRLRDLLELLGLSSPFLNWNFFFLERYLLLDRHCFSSWQPLLTDRLFFFMQKPQGLLALHPQ